MSTLRLVSSNRRSSPSGASPILEKSQEDEPCTPNASASHCGVIVAARMTPRLRTITHATGRRTRNARQTAPLTARLTSRAIATPNRSQGDQGHDEGSCRAHGRRRDQAQIEAA